MINIFKYFKKRKEEKDILTHPEVQQAFAEEELSKVDLRKKDLNRPTLP